MSNAVTINSPGKKAAASQLRLRWKNFNVSGSSSKTFVNGIPESGTHLFKCSGIVAPVEGIFDPL